MKDSHLSLRLPRELAQALAVRARRHGVPRSHLVREAVKRYLEPASPPAGPPELQPGVTARALAARWKALPRLEPADVESFVDDIVAGRRALPGPGDPWE